MKGKLILEGTYAGGGLHREYPSFFGYLQNTSLQYKPVSRIQRRQPHRIVFQTDNEPSLKFEPSSIALMTTGFALVCQGRGLPAVLINRPISYPEAIQLRHSPQRLDGNRFAEAPRRRHRQ